MPEIKVLLTYEILGRPPEYIQEALKKFIDDFDKKTGITIISKKFHEPKPLEKQQENEDTKGLFTTFAEVELELENLNLLFSIVLNTLPANIEILSPSSLSMNNFNLSELFCELTIKLHKFDEVAKILAIERDNLAKELNQIRSNSQVRVSTNIKPEDKGDKEDVKEIEDENNENKKIKDKDKK